ncbi:hypothetical protein KJ068_11345 [bacterium]|nr:hypothetical protein [bacterium]
MAEFISQAVIFLTNNAFTAVVNFLSLISFLLTVSVFLTLRKIRRNYVFKGRVPKLAEDLKKHSSKIIECLNNFDGFLPEIQEELARAKVTTKYLIKNTDGSLRDAIQQLDSKINTYETDTGESELRKIYLEMVSVNTEILNTFEDKTWEIQS